jgi:hypothetical protein
MSDHGKPRFSLSCLMPLCYFWTLRADLGAPCWFRAELNLSGHHQSMSKLNFVLLETSSECWGNFKPCRDFQDLSWLSELGAAAVDGAAVVLILLC